MLFVMKIGFIGLGHMGSGMARNLLRAGHEPFVLTKTDQHQEHDLPEGKRYGQQCRNPQLKWTLRDQLRVITGDTHGCKWSATPPQSRRTQLDTGFDERRDGPPVSVRQDPSLTLPQTQVHPRHR
jgi:hypothetical protein